MTWRFYPDEIPVRPATPLDARTTRRLLDKLLSDDRTGALDAARRLGFSEPEKAAIPIRTRLAAGEHDAATREHLAALLLRIGVERDVDAVADGSLGTGFPCDRLASHAAADFYARERAAMHRREPGVVVARIARTRPGWFMSEDSLRRQRPGVHG